MHPFFSVTLFTGQQLVLEAVQRWLQRPCADAESQRQRRLGLKGLVTLLLRTAATGLLAAVLDAAIEFRRRQLLAAAAVEPGEASAGGSAAGGTLMSRLPGLGGMLSRAGIAAWKSRLLLCVDELERRAEAYGIEPRHRHSEEGEGKPAVATAEAALPGGSASSKAAVELPAAAEGEEDEEGPGGERSQRLGRTVEQLRELVKQGDAESERRLDEEVGSLVDLLLGTLPAAANASPSQPPSPGGSGVGGSQPSRSASQASRLDGLADAAGPLTDGAAAAAGALLAGTAACCSQPQQRELCHICMDRHVRVQVVGCHHELCFGCARRLCATQDHSMPQCPFCRQAIDGFQPIPPAAAATASAGPAEAVSAPAAVHI